MSFCCLRLGIYIYIWQPGKLRIWMFWKPHNLLITWAWPWKLCILVHGRPKQSVTVKYAKQSQAIQKPWLYHTGDKARKRRIKGKDYVQRVFLLLFGGGHTLIISSWLELYSGPGYSATYPAPSWKISHQFAQVLYWLPNVFWKLLINRNELTKVYAFLLFWKLTVCCLGVYLMFPDNKIHIVYI